MNYIFVACPSSSWKSTPWLFQLWQRVQDQARDGGIWLSKQKGTFFNLPYLLWFRLCFRHTTKPVTRGAMMMLSALTVERNFQHLTHFLFTKQDGANCDCWICVFIWKIDTLVLKLWCPLVLKLWCPHIKYEYHNFQIILCLPPVLPCGQLLQTRLEAWGTPWRTSKVEPHFTASLNLWSGPFSIPCSNSSAPSFLKVVFHESLVQTPRKNYLPKSRGKAFGALFYIEPPRLRLHPLSHLPRMVHIDRRLWPVWSANRLLQLCLPKVQESSLRMPPLPQTGPKNSVRHVGSWFPVKEILRNQFFPDKFNLKAEPLKPSRLPCRISRGSCW